MPGECSSRSGSLLSRTLLTSPRMRRFFSGFSARVLRREGDLEGTRIPGADPEHLLLELLPERDAVERTIDTLSLLVHRFTAAVAVNPNSSRSPIRALAPFLGMKVAYGVRRRSIAVATSSSVTFTFSLYTGIPCNLRLDFRDHLDRGGEDEVLPSPAWRRPRRPWKHLEVLLLHHLGERLLHQVLRHLASTVSRNNRFTIPSRLPLRNPAPAPSGEAP